MNWCDVRSGLLWSHKVSDSVVSMYCRVVDL